MRQPSRSLLLGAAAALVLQPFAFTSRQAPASVDRNQLLGAAAAYIAHYEDQFSSVVSDELYLQTVKSGGLLAHRQFIAEIVLLNLGDGNWLGLRDVFSVDNKPVRDRQDRILQLLLHPSADALDQAKRVAAESARFNIGPVQRTINTPTLALAFLRATNQQRSSFDVQKVESQHGTQVATLHFLETASPRMITTPDDAPAEGRFWIETATGRVRQSELTLKSADGSARITVAYEERPNISVWMPTSMKETYELPNAIIDGIATYSHFKQAKVDVATIVKK